MKTAYFVLLLIGFFLHKQYDKQQVATSGVINSKAAHSQNKNLLSNPTINASRFTGIDDCITRMKTLGRDCPPHLLREFRIRAETASLEQLNKLAESIDAINPRHTFVLRLLVKEVATKDTASAWIILNKIPIGVQQSALPSLIEGVARRDHLEALSVAGNATPSQKEAVLSAVYIGWADRDAELSWSSLIALESPPEAAILNVGRSVTAKAPELIKRYFHQLESTGKSPPEGMLLQCLAGAAESETGIDEKILSLFPVKHRSEALAVGAQLSLAANAAELQELTEGTFRAEEREAIQKSWAASHPQQALLDATLYPELSKTLRMGIIENAMQNPNEAKTAWEKLTDNKKFDLLPTMANGIAVHGVSDALEWAASLEGSHRSVALEEIFKTSFPREPALSMDRALEIVDQNDRIRAVAAVSSAWANTEPNAAANWIVEQRNQSTLDSGLAQILPKWSTRDATGMVEWLKAVDLPLETLEPILNSMKRKNPDLAALLVELDQTQEQSGQ